MRCFASELLTSLQLCERLGVLVVYDNELCLNVNEINGGCRKEEGHS